MPPCALQLVDKSADLSMASQMFYKQAKKANSCCRWVGGWVLLSLALHEEQECQVTCFTVVHSIHSPQYRYI